MLLGIDWAWGRISPTSISAHGYRVVLRYVSPLSDGKCISAAEARSYLDAGLQIVLVWEHTADQIRNGRGQGAADGAVARQILDSIGCPSNVCVYLAADYEAPTSDWPNIAAYMDEFRIVVGRPVGIYGDDGLCTQMLHDGHASFVWQTAAWSAGQLMPGANIYQPAVTVVIDGVSCDVDKILTDDVGQWPRPGTQPTPPTPPIPFKVQPMFNPALVLAPIAAAASVVNGSGVILAASDGSIYCFGTGAQFHGGANNQAYFAGRQVAELRCAPFPQNPYTIKDTAGEFYDLGYQAGQAPIRW